MNLPSPEHMTSGAESAFYVDPWRLEIIKTLERGQPDTWGATPLDPYSPGTPGQQFQLMKSFRHLFEDDLPEGISPQLAEYIEEVNYGRVEHRRHKNFESFCFRGVQDMTSGPDYILDMAERALTGNASPAEIHLLGEYYQILTRELGCITAPYGKRLREHLPKLRSAVRNNVLLHGGKLLSTPPSYEVKAVTYAGPLSARNLPPMLLMTRRYDIGMIGDSVIDIERSSFLLRLDKLSEYRSELAQKVSSIDPLRVAGWRTAIVAIPGFTDTISQLLEADAHTIAIPLAVTAFEVNTDLERKLLANNEGHYHKRMHSLRFNENNPDGDTLRRRHRDGEA